MMNKKYFAFGFLSCLVLFGVFYMIPLGSSNFEIYYDDISLKGVFNYILPTPIINWMLQQNYVIDVQTLETGGYNLTEVWVNESLIDENKVLEVGNSYDYQRTHLNHFETNLQGYNVPIACGRDTATNELYKIEITNGQINLNVVEECIQ